MKGALILGPGTKASDVLGKTETGAYRMVVVLPSQEITQIRYRKRKEIPDRVDVDLITNEGEDEYPEYDNSFDGHYYHYDHQANNNENCSSASCFWAMANSSSAPEAPRATDADALPAPRAVDALPAPRATDADALPAPRATDATLGASSAALST